MSDGKVTGGKTKCGSNFTLYEREIYKNWEDHSRGIPGLGEMHGRHFLKEMAGFTGCAISIHSLPPGAGMPIRHAHEKNEEVYIVIQGQGQMQIDGEILDVREGSIVRVLPDGQRAWRNNSTEPLLYIVAQMKESSPSQYGLRKEITSGNGRDWIN